MPDFGAFPHDTKVEILRDFTEQSTAIDEVVDMFGATRLIIVESVEPPSATPPDRDGPQFAGAATTDGDLGTNVQEQASGAGGQDNGVWDFNSIAVRDLFVKANAENTSNGSGSLLLQTSDDNSSWTTRYTVPGPNPPAATVEKVIFTGSFRYVRAQLNSNVSIGGMIGRIFQVGEGVHTQLDIQFKDDARSSSTYRTVMALASFDGSVNGIIRERITYISQNEISQGEGDVDSNLVKTRLIMPSVSESIKFVDPGTANRKHSITLYKVYTN